MARRRCTGCASRGAIVAHHDSCPDRPTARRSAFIVESDGGFRVNLLAGTRLIRTEATDSLSHAKRVANAWAPN